MFVRVGEVVEKHNMNKYLDVRGLRLYWHREIPLYEGQGFAVALAAATHSSIYLFSLIFLTMSI